MSTARALTSLLRRRTLAFALASCFAGYAYANPTNPTVISGAATFAASGKNLNITNTPGAVINWKGFSVSADEVTRFIQQNAQSAVLNRVVSQEQSAILGQLLSNGRVYLINQNGITIGAGARIDTAGFVASSLNLSDGDALAGRFKLQDSGSSGKVINNGSITTASGGFVYLIAPDVENNGIITSPKGEIILAAGKSVELVDSQKPELRVELTAPENTAVNVGKLIAEAGTVGIFAGTIRQSGLISANSAVVGENGKIFFKAKKDITLTAGSRTEASGPQGGSITIQSEAGAATIAGAVEANGTQGKGGTISVAAPVAVTVASTARVSADGTEGGSVTLASSAGPVTIAASVTANATVGRAGQVAVSAATTAVVASTGRLGASGGQGGGAIAVKVSSGVTFESDSEVQTSGATGGSVAVQAEQGTVEANSAFDVSGSEGAGGSIQISARADITLEIASKILASGRSGGEVRIESGEGALLASGLIDGQGRDGPGGRVWLLAPRVGLIREAVVDVSGQTGGGLVLIGGNFQGKGPEANATVIFMGSGASINADAIGNGDGGKVVLWSDNTTRAYGHISARGGAQGGDGGFVEVSGKQYLDYRGRVDTRAPMGRTGTLLLDPDGTIDINNTNATDATDTPAGTFTVAVDTAATINWSDINADLANTDVTVTAGAITISELGTLVNATPRSLSMFASTGSIDIGAGITSTISANNYNFTAGGGITLGANLITPGGNIQFNSATTLTAANPTLTAGTGDINFVSTIAGAGNSLTTSNTGAWSVTGSITNMLNLTVSGGPTSVALPTTTLTGNLDVTSGASISQTGALAVGGTSSLTATSTIVLDDVTNDFVGALSASGTDITLADANSLTTSIAATGLG
ncbi:MAG: filamentous hemagglutinin N-terminal domain-containing protein, partial [Burkholderiales bacterium]|nr:filamentous hemagglutinin N-terminal domain-containing protein [Burkholderiales bacterium]